MGLLRPFVLAAFQKISLLQSSAQRLLVFGGPRGFNSRPLCKASEELSFVCPNKIKVWPFEAASCFTQKSKPAAGRRSSLQMCNFFHSLDWREVGAHLANQQARFRRRRRKLKFCSFERKPVQLAGGRRQRHSRAPDNSLEMSRGRDLSLIRRAGALPNWSEVKLGLA